ncbi:MAG: OmpH family outer membrane protein [Candidatus Omnitrophica bacterium]|nr:OmpH family outer membrane protein [Candidatus Omnitrophota bacterium]
MKKTGITVLGVIFGMLLAGSVLAADKFAYVDLGRIFSEYSKTKDYDKVLGDKENEYSSEREKKINEIKQYQDKMNLMNDKEKESKKPDLEKKIKSLQDYDRDQQTELRKEQNEKLKEISKDVEEAIKKYAEKEGYTFVFDDRILVYQTKSMEITDKVIDILNKGKKR